MNLLADIKTFDINDYVIDLENNKIEYYDEKLVFKHEYQDLLRLSVLSEVKEYPDNRIPLYIQIDSIETVLVDDNIKIPKFVQKGLNDVLRYTNNPIKLGGQGTIRHKHISVEETFPFIFKDEIFLQGVISL